MILKRWAVTLALAVGTMALILACDASNLSFISQAQPTSTPTRTPRPTFTPRPEVTDTPAATDTPEAIATSAPTEAPPTATLKPKAPTTRPVQPTAKPKPYTPLPPPPTNTPQPTQNPYTYTASKVTCTHAGQAYIKGAVCNDRNCGDKIAGMNVVLSDSPDGAELVKVQTDPSGEYTFVLNGNGPRPGNWYAWVVSSQDQRISTVSPVIPLGPGNENDVNACPNTAAFLDFFRP